jgi:uncharacterized coiled-coil protein SlyX
MWGLSLYIYLFNVAKDGDKPVQTQSQTNIWVATNAGGIFMRKIDQLNKLQSEMMEARTKVEDLCYDWGWTLSDKTTNDNKIIEELKMQLDIAKEELAYYHDVEKDYNNDIKLFKEENAKLIDENIELEGQIAFKDGQILGLNNQIKELQAKIEELTNAKLDSIVKKHVEGDDAMEQPKAQPKKKNSPMYEKLMKVVKEEKQQEEIIVKETEEYAINFKQVVRNKKVNDFSTTMSEICGEITIDGTYKFKATNNYYAPIVYGCFDEKVTLQWPIVPHLPVGSQMYRPPLLPAHDYGGEEENCKDRAHPSRLGPSCCRQDSTSRRWGYSP